MVSLLAVLCNPVVTLVVFSFGICVASLSGEDPETGVGASSIGGSIKGDSGLAVSLATDGVAPISVPDFCGSSLGDLILSSTAEGREGLLGLGYIIEGAGMCSLWNGVNFLRCFRFRSVTRPEPSILIEY